MSLSDPSAPVPRPPSGRPLVWAAVALLILAGGAAATTATYYAIHPPPGGSGTVQVTDDLGRTVTVPRNASRVVVLGPSIMDIMYRLGLRSQVVGVDCYAAADGGLSED